MHTEGRLSFVILLIHGAGGARRREVNGFLTEEARGTLSQARKGRRDPGGAKEKVDGHLLFPPGSSISAVVLMTLVTFHLTKSEGEVPK